MSVFAIFEKSTKSFAVHVHHSYVTNIDEAKLFKTRETAMQSLKKMRDKPDTCSPQMVWHVDGVSYYGGTDLAAFMNKYPQYGGTLTLLRPDLEVLELKLSVV